MNLDFALVFDSLMRKKCAGTGFFKKDLDTTEDLND